MNVSTRKKAMIIKYTCSCIYKLLNRHLKNTMILKSRFLAADCILCFLVAHYPSTGHCVYHHLYILDDAYKM